MIKIFLCHIILLFRFCVYVYDGLKNFVLTLSTAFFSFIGLKSKIFSFILFSIIKATLIPTYYCPCHYATLHASLCQRFFHFVSCIASILMLYFFISFRISQCIASVQALYMFHMLIIISIFCFLCLLSFSDPLSEVSWQFLFFWREIVSRSSNFLFRRLFLSSSSALPLRLVTRSPAELLRFSGVHPHSFAMLREGENRN